MSNRPTYIYWLFDTRPEVIAETGWRCGVPFYCGKTELPIKARLSQHRQQAKAAKAPVNRRVLKHVLECGPHIRTDQIDFVAPLQNWRSRERYWIKVLRKVNKHCTNSRDGGEYDISVETRQKMRVANLGRKATPESIERMRGLKAGVKLSSDHKRAISEGWEKRRRKAAISTHPLIVVDRHGIATVIRNPPGFDKPSVRDFLYA